VVCVASSFSLPPSSSSSSSSPSLSSLSSGLSLERGAERGAEGGAGTELWRSNGTVEGTERLEDLFPGVTGSNPTSLVSLGSLLFFAAEDPVEGRELFFSSGEPNSATILPLFPGPQSSSPTELIAVADSRAIVMAATVPFVGRELVVLTYPVDVSPALYAFASPSITVIDLVSGPENAFPGDFCAFQGNSFPVLFRATVPGSGSELFVSTDGSAQGTGMLKDICPGPCSSSPRFITFFQSKFYFQVR